MKRFVILVLSVLCVTSVILSCSPESDKLKPYITPKYDGHIDASEGNFIFDPSVDILFVIDNSGSMDSHQQNLAKNIQLFVNQIKAVTVLDYQIGVISTDEYDDGQLLGTPTYVTKNTFNMVAVLSRNLLIGTNGSGYEMAFDPVYAALHPPQVTGANIGFYRPNSYLAIIFITDAEDQSGTQDAQSLYQALLQLKNGDADKLMAYGAIIPSGVTNCIRDSTTEPKRIEEFLKLMKGTSFSLCAPDFGVKLAELGNNLVNRVAKVIRLTRAPIPSTIVVKYGSQIIPNDILKGWTFEPKTNSIYLGPDLKLTTQPTGTRIEVLFESAPTI